MVEIQKNAFQKFFGWVENDYTKAIGFTLQICRPFCAGLVKALSTRLRTKNENLSLALDAYATDSAIAFDVFIQRFLGEPGQIDIVIELSNGFVIGIENKKGAPFTGQDQDQFSRYLRCFEGQYGDRFVLVCLTPSHYRHASHIDAAHPNTAHLTYSDLAAVVRDLAPTGPGTTALFDGAYYQAFLSYLEIAEEDVAFGASGDIGRSSRKRYDQNWNTPKDWIGFFRTIRKNGFVFPSTGILLGAMVEKEEGFVVEKFEHLETAWLLAVEFFKHQGHDSERKSKRGLAEYVMDNKNNEEFWSLARTIAKRLSSFPLSENLAGTVEEAIRRIEDRVVPGLLEDFVHAINYCTVLRAEFMDK